MQEPPIAATCPLSALHPGAAGTVLKVGADGPMNTIERRLLELGFVPGERFEVLSEARPGGDPLAVRIGATVFAMRRREVEPILVAVDAARG